MYEETDEKVTEEVDSCCTLVDLALSKKKRRSKGAVEHAEKPKKPRSAYLLYYFDVHQRLQQDHPDMPQSEINKCISDSWKRLNVADKGYYLERAKMEKDGLDSSQTTQSSTSQDIPGFRRILPRTDYVLLPKTSVTEDKPGASIDICMDGESPLTLGSEVELVEQCVTVEPLTEDAVMPLSRSATLQGVRPQSSTSTGRLLSRQATSFVVRENENEASGRAFGKKCDMKVEERFEDVAAVSQVKAETAHLVAIIPSHELVESKFLPAINPVMMLPFVNHSKPEPKPSFKLSIKYTRRGRGYCSTPGCSFTYVTRHKPPCCPDCGQHLGGKWVRSAAKKVGPGSISSQQNLKAQTEASSLVPAKVAAQSNVKQTRTPKNKKHKTVPYPKVQPDIATASENAPGSWKKDKLGVVTVSKPAGGAFDKIPEAFRLSGSTAVIGLSDGHVQVISKDAGQKRRIRAILPAPSTSSIASQPTVVQWIAVPPSKIKGDAISKTGKPQSERILGLKPSTLKQLGHPVSHSLEQKTPASNSSQYVVTNSGVKILSMVPLKKTSHGTSLALGLSTARGRGKCKNPSCDYIYKNRHKPQYCPSCGCELATKATKKSKVPSSPEPSDMSTLPLDPSQPLTLSQKELQRQSTVTLLKHSLNTALQFPETDSTKTELHPGYNIHIHILHTSTTSTKHTRRTMKKTSRTTRMREKERRSVFHLRTDGRAFMSRQPHTAVCVTIHFTEEKKGLFNVGNQLLVSLDLFFKIRTQIKHDRDPSLAALDIINNTHSPPGCVLSPDEQTRVQELLCSGYWAFECLTARDFNDMICGICGIAPKVEIARRSTNSVLQLKNVEFTWPEFQTSDEVQVEEFWMTMESEALEQAVFPSTVSITRFDASIIAPFFPALMRSSMVVNTEKDKLTTKTEHTGGDELIMAVCLLYTQVQNGLSTGPQPAEHLTAGKLSKVCPHQVVCGSKYLVRGETARDHVDLLVSSRFWPPVYVADCAQKVALCSEAVYPELASQMWGKNQGCFSDPMTPAKYISCPELQDQQYSMDLSSVDSHSHVHPHTKSSLRYIVHPGDPFPPSSSPSSSSSLSDPHRALTLCKELQCYSNLVSLINSGSEENQSKENEKQRMIVFNNAAHYYLYNRLVDFLSSRDVVSQQMAEVLRVCQQGEVVMIRDGLYRLGVAQLNREDEEKEHIGEEDNAEDDEDSVAMEEVVLE
ncbi:HMG domain-containing protein 3 [Bagarius yarrelli]|uniref:HMG domain-containing protein 3 n=1 Tax=Bagarius yarrelli TaxID=175774 RepID=A0A556UZV1_BAGYA|nr:HMG domain-containing protein 3 [Bagarius yarrelli]